MGLTLDKLSYGKANSTIYGMHSQNYEFFDNFGAVLNSRGFPGAITFKNNVIENNLVHVRDVRPELLTDAFILETSTQKFDDLPNG